MMRLFTNSYPHFSVDCSTNFETMHQKLLKINCDVTRRHENADVTQRHEKAGVTHLPGFFTEVKASRDICAEVPYYSAPKHLILVLFCSREASRDIFAEGIKILCSETFNFSPVLFARRSRRYEKYSLLQNIQF